MYYDQKTEVVTLGENEFHCHELSALGFAKFTEAQQEDNQVNMMAVLLQQGVNEFKGKKVDQILNSINLDMLTDLGSKVIELSGLDSDDDGDEKKS